MVSLNLNGNNLDGALPSNLFTNLHGLKSITLYRNEISDVPDAICKFLVDQHVIFCDLSLNPFDDDHCPTCIADYCVLPANATCTGGQPPSPGQATDAGKALMFLLVAFAIVLQVVFCAGCCCCILRATADRAKAQLQIRLYEAKANAMLEERLLNSSADASLSDSRSSITISSHFSSSEQQQNVRHGVPSKGIIAIALLTTMVGIFIGVVIVGIIIVVIVMRSEAGSDGHDGGGSDSGGGGHEHSEASPSDIQIAMCLFGILQLADGATKQCAELFEAWHFAVVAALLYELVSVPLHAGRLTHVEGVPYPSALWHAFTHQFWCCKKRHGRRESLGAGGFLTGQILATDDESIAESEVETIETVEEDDMINGSNSIDDSISDSGDDDVC